MTNAILLLLLSASARAAVLDVHCENSAEDSARINGAIQTSAAGSRIAIHGTCSLTDTVVLRGNRTYSGDSRTGTILRQANGSNLPALLAGETWQTNGASTGSPLRIEHMTIDGNRANNEGTSNLVIRSWLTVLNDLQIQNAPQDGVRIVNPSANGTRLTSTQVNGHIGDLFIRNSGANGLRVLDPGNAVTDWDFLDTWIANSGQSAIHLDNAAGWKIKGVHIYGVGEHAIYAHRCFATTIADNLIENFGESGGEAKTWYGIACTVQGQTGSVISGNKIFRFGKLGVDAHFAFLAVPRTNYGTGAINVSGNIVRGAKVGKETGLLYEVGPSASALHVMSTGNHVSDVATPRSAGEKVSFVDPL